MQSRAIRKGITEYVSYRVSLEELLGIFQAGWKGMMAMVGVWRSTLSKAE